MVKDLPFSKGTIEFDAKGRDVVQKNFIGIAFHGIDNELMKRSTFVPSISNLLILGAGYMRYNTHMNRNLGFSNSATLKKTNII